ncbi:MAG: phenylalanyl-tRNA synthetase beta chain [Parcubacteria group bacterium Gr01-1014_3]|nr:MAG: phenylalanyl-tRNA synthetase beta chain [Parcubacteria group bacterium Gr01-1014_3]
MKFSYSLLKKFLPSLKGIGTVAELLPLHALEVESFTGDMIDIKITANRYSDASSHWGIGKMLSAILDAKFDEPSLASMKPKKQLNRFDLKISDKEKCSRYSGLYAEIKNVGESPKWMQDILISCGLRPINGIVDLMNYVMLEVGQPLHAFDADLVSAGIDVRRGISGEKIQTIDGAEYSLSGEDLVIADSRGPLAIAGIKGGKRAEINKQTKRIIVEAASFEPVGIYKTSRRINLITDASGRFAHGLSGTLVERAIQRTAQLLKEVYGATIGDWVDLNYQKSAKVLIKFDIKKFNHLTGMALSEKQALDYLKRLDFAIKGKMVTPPSDRTDITRFEDLAEEIVNLHGYNNLTAIAPMIGLRASGQEDLIALKDQARRVLTGFGLSEVYNYSFVSEKDLIRYGELTAWKTVHVANPVSSDLALMRPWLGINLVKNLEHNLKFHDQVRIFEIGKTFNDIQGKVSEELVLGMAIAYKKGSPTLELKGLAEQLLERLGLTDYFTRDLDTDIRFLNHGESLIIESDHQILGYVGSVKADLPASGGLKMAVAEIYLEKLLKLIVGEKEFLPLPKYPNVMRDISLLVKSTERVGPIQDLIENASHLLEDVDLVDWYEDESLGMEKKSLSFRLVFRSDKKTLTDEEVGQEMAKIISELKAKFELEVR